MNNTLFLLLDYLYYIPFAGKLAKSKKCGVHTKYHFHINSSKSAMVIIDAR